MSDIFPNRVKEADFVRKAQRPIRVARSILVSLALLLTVGSLWVSLRDCGYAILGDNNYSCSSTARVQQSESRTNAEVAMTEAEARRTPEIIDGYLTLAEGAIIDDLGPKEKRFYRFTGGNVTVHVPTGGWCLGYPTDSLKVVSESADHLTVIVTPLREEVIAYLRIKSEGCKKPVKERRA